MTTLFVKNAEVLATMDRENPLPEIKDGALLVVDHRIEFVGTTAELVDV